MERGSPRCRSGLLGFRRVARNTDERNCISCIFPWGPASYGWILSLGPGPIYLCLLLAGYNSLPFDYLLRSALSQPSIPQGTFEQIAIPRPEDASEPIKAQTLSHVIELTYTGWDLKAFADDVWRDSDESLRNLIRHQWTENKNLTGGHEFCPPEWAEIAKDGIPLAPFKWDEDRRAQIRAELDAYYALLYGLTRDELRYILDPKDVYGPDLPGETFRVLKEKEEKQFGEYRTRRLVLEAFDKLAESRGAERGCPVRQ